MSIPNYRISVLGAGSIGARHVRNLKKIGVERLTVYDPSKEKLSRLLKECPGVQIHSSYEEVLNKDCDVAFIASPNSFHMQQAIDFASKGCHLFIEKPLSHSLEGIDSLQEVLKQKHLISLVACNRRFQPAMAKTREVIASERLGKIFNYRIQCASYFPNWRSGTDYRENYGASKEQGGGVILDTIHEFDLARWFFGEIDEVMAVAEKRSDLDIDVEDTAEIIFRHENGVVGQVGLSYVTSGNFRSHHIACEKGTLDWNLDSKEVRIFERGHQRSRSLENFKKYDFNNAYIKMLHHFFNCLEKGETSLQNVSEGKEALRIALAAKESAETGRKVLLRQFV